MRLIVACSGGADSLALLHLIQQTRHEIIVAHVNFHLRKEAEKESEILAAYCQDKQLRFIRYDAYYKGGNMEAWARTERYHFLAKLSKKYDCQYVLIAHHQDDLLETYLMQKERRLQAETYGLNYKLVYEDVIFLRPLLKFRKEDILYYCQQYHLPYSTDSSNEDERYHRNRIRKEVNKLSFPERKKLLDEIYVRNEKAKEIREFIKDYQGKMLKESLFFKTGLEKEIIRLWCPLSLSESHLEEALRQLKSKEKISIPLAQDYYLCREYGYIYCFRDTKHYEIKIDKSNLKYFEISSGKPLYLSESDFPLILRNAREGDNIQLAFGHKKLNRYFIDSKIYTCQRKSWPVLVNKNDEVIFVQGIGADIKHQAGTNGYHLDFETFKLKINKYHS